MAADPQVEKIVRFVIAIGILVTISIVFSGLDSILTCGFFMFLMLILGAIGWGIGSTRGRPADGAILGAILGPIGWAIVYFGPDRTVPKKWPGQP